MVVVFNVRYHPTACLLATSADTLSETPVQPAACSLATPATRGGLVSAELHVNRRCHSTCLFQCWNATVYIRRFRYNSQHAPNPLKTNGAVLGNMAYDLSQ